jgi:protein-L-isoaspartate(D-aspartate) O-methyltransferase
MTDRGCVGIVMVEFESDDAPGRPGLPGGRRNGLGLGKATAIANAVALAACSNGGVDPAAEPPVDPEWLAARGEFEDERLEMVERDLRAMPGRPVQDEAVLAAMSRVPRHRFVPPPWRVRAYADMPLPIGHDQTISQPYIVALMTELLGVGRGSRVLEVGTGSGYQAAVLAELGAEVFSIEIVEPLAASARQVLDDLDYLGPGKVSLRVGDGYAGWPEQAPFDAVIVTCAPDHVPPPLVDQLADGGRMVIPVGEEGGVQELTVLRKSGDALTRIEVLPVRFVPMTGEAERR